MAPNKARPVSDDVRPSPQTTKDRLTNLSQPAGPAKMRRGASSQGANITPKEAQKDKEPPAAPTPMTTTQEPVATGIQGIQWQTMSSESLHAYRHAYRLPIAPAFTSGYNQLVLSQCSIGKNSPTMARRKQHRQQSKETLAGAIRKHFNDTGIVENDAIVEFLYKVKHQDKAFRLKFTPQKQR